VSCLEKSPEREPISDGDDAMLAECEYFAVRRVRADGKFELFADEDSFLSLMITGGEGKICYGGGELDFCLGDSIFIPAQKGSFSVVGKCELIISKVN
jgi:mannose-6-phosphate isomerase